MRKERVESTEKLVGWDVGHELAVKAAACLKGKCPSSLPIPVLPKAEDEPCLLLWSASPRTTLPWTYTTSRCAPGNSQLIDH
ncbi:hypothetical protein PCANC_23880 [Puccinia coronata f. sp. avenae]|uniref:Uncharacterized protein n=1 Tax=Puccinia coronata f. sp. avenae TaxID=200324 RepID=A0A2N5TZ51_9BASI|nr:hypothetical protein PCANC_23880 [Puccinia coronata f. sp. avenae]